ncbi:MAG TPA: HEAT repeat domain-containing protein [bacterium]|jgi:HEAT repeat protein|nr:HEAT repeat domain-containing protein [bacterium]HNT66735.1 HEAT repeat domain-containing protein [bacterium]HOX85116.1 HEAT repeat domain-containing protein [bacterium]HPG47039.1 HEAT repeat domain-containing protein [bacterium]HPM99373.1 HEAT repeat domain-containing protein [bacterium]
MKRSAFLSFLLLSLFAVALTAFASVNTNEAASQLSEKDQNLLKDLQDPELSTRTKAAKALCKHCLPQAVDPLIEMMKNDDSYQARILAAMALYEQGDAKGFQAIKEQADKDPRQTVRTTLRGLCQKIDQSAS